MTVNTEIPDLPVQLEGNSRAISEWFKRCDELIKRKVLQTVDLSMLAVYCAEYAAYWDCTEKLLKSGITHQGRHGEVRSPYVIVANRYYQNMVAQAKQFGITPAVRGRIQGKTRARRVRSYFGINAGMIILNSAIL